MPPRLRSEFVFLKLLIPLARIPSLSEELDVDHGEVSAGQNHDQQEQNHLIDGLLVLELLHDSLGHVEFYLDAVNLKGKRTIRAGEV